MLSKGKRAFSVAALGVWLVALSQPAFSQCAMCKSAVSSAADAAKAASSMNLAVLVLLIPPVLIFCAFFLMLYRYRRAPEVSPTPGIDGEVSANVCAKEEIVPAAKRNEKGRSSRLFSAGRVRLRGAPPLP